jgi:hypothetical protein
VPRFLENWHCFILGIDIFMDIVSIGTGLLQSLTFFWRISLVSIGTGSGMCALLHCFILIILIKGADMYTVSIDTGNFIFRFFMINIEIL